MKKHVWIFNHYAGGMYFEKGGRHYNFAKYLQRAEYEPVVFCCNAKHGKSEYFFDFEGLWYEQEAKEIHTPFVFVNARIYTGNGKQRVLNMIDFYRNVKKAAKEYAEQHGSPDVIYASSVHPLTLVAGIQLAKHFGVECICEVRDLWPESIVEYSTRLTKTNPVVRLLYAGERWIYRRADALLFTFEGGYDYILERGWEKVIPQEKVFYINNGVELEQFDYNRNRFQIQDDDLDNEKLFKVVYTGSIRRVNNLGLLIDTAKAVTDSRIKFLVWGDGNELPALRQRVEQEQIDNVVFKGRVEKKYVPYIVSKANMNIAHNNPSELFRFGISFNKLFDYIAGGKPILADFPCRYNPAIQWGAGIEVNNPTSAEIAKAIETSAKMQEEEYAMFCSNARIAANEFDFANLTKKLIAVFEQI